MSIERDLRNWRTSNRIIGVGLIFLSCINYINFRENSSLSNREDIPRTSYSSEDSGIPIGVLKDNHVLINGFTYKTDDFYPIDKDIKSQMVSQYDSDGLSRLVFLIDE